MAAGVSKHGECVGTPPSCSFLVRPFHSCRHMSSIGRRFVNLCQRTKTSFFSVRVGLASEGFEVARLGDARVALIGFPSVGKSTLQCQLTGTESEAAEYEFTTLTCIPGTMHYKKSKVQVLDLPGIIEGAAHGKGRGREVIACARNADAILIVLDAGKEGLNRHREILENELETVGIRLNERPPDVTFNKKKMGGVRFASTVPLTKLGPDPEKLATQIMREYRITSADLLAREDITVDQLVDVIVGNRRVVSSQFRSASCF